MDEVETRETVESLSALYLGNILYALERCALDLEREGKAADAGFYRGIARKLAEARGREKAGISKAGSRDK
jgi:hypothetical protein